MFKSGRGLVLGTILLATQTVAAASDCEVTAADMKLTGAAKNSFMQKCQRDSGCESKAAEKKLSGAAKNSFVKKCIKDAKAAAK